MPAPASSCGRIVQAAFASGTNASASTPPAISAAPAAARVAAGPGMRDARMAAIGSTVTTPAAASGDRLQPETSSSTSRNSTAVSAADTSASAAAGAGRTRGSGSAGAASVSALRSVSRRAATTHAIAPAAAIGAWTKKIARQSNACVTAPPSAGPAAVPNTAAAVHKREPAPPA